MHLVSDKRGAAVVEFAMLAPFLLLLLAGVTDYGRYLLQSMQMAGALRAAVQAGIDSDQLDLAAVKAVAADQLALSDLTVDASTEETCPEDSSLNQGNCSGYGKAQLFLTVTANAPFQATFLLSLGPLSRQATGRLR